MSTFKGFSTVELQAPKRSVFDLTHDKRLSTKMARLTPVMVQECLPGDKWKGSTEALIRLAPLNSPIYDQITVFVHFFFVPNRLLWEDWEEFITGGRLGVGVDPVEAPVPPHFSIGDALDMDGETEPVFGNSTLADYLGVPDLSELAVDPVAEYSAIQMDVLPFAAYYKIWYDYYRDRNYITDEDDTVPGRSLLPLPSGDWDPHTPDQRKILLIKNRDYLKDYFTSALPFTQRGEEVLMPLSGTGSVTYLDNSVVRNSNTDAAFTSDVYLGQVANDESLIGSVETTTPPTAGTNARIENIDEVLLTASSVSINDFRSAYALQVWLERNAVAGSRYVESNKAHFNVNSQDSRLQRAEYIGGGRLPIKISEVVTSAFSSNGVSTVPAGNLQGHGVGYADLNQFRYYCPEHGFIMGILSIMSPPSYQQGLPRMFYQRRSFLGYPWPTFAKLGEQQVDKAELYASPANLTEDEAGLVPLFGYQGRYADWKYMYNSNHGAFRDTLLFWTLTRVFDDSPELGEEFVAFDQTTQERIFIVNQSLDNFWIYAHNKLSVVRALPYFGTPNTLGF